MAPKQKQNILCREEELSSSETVTLGDTQTESSPAAFGVIVHEA